MSQTTKRPLSEVMAALDDFTSLVKPDLTCNRWEVAGSIRRQRSHVGDVDIIAIPRIGDVPVEGSLFGDTVWGYLLWQRVDDLVKLGKFAHAVKDTAAGPREKWGDSCRAIAFRGMIYEIQLCDEDNWGGWLAVRTGPDPLPRLLVMGIEKNGYSCRGGFHLHDRAGKLIEKCTEAQFFEAARISMKPPHQR